MWTHAHEHRIHLLVLGSKECNKNRVRRMHTFWIGLRIRHQLPSGMKNCSRITRPAMHCGQKIQLCQRILQLVCFVTKFFFVFVKPAVRRLIGEDKREWFNEARSNRNVLLCSHKVILTGCVRIVTQETTYLGVGYITFTGFCMRTNLFLKFLRWKPAVARYLNIVGAKLMKET